MNSQHTWTRRNEEKNFLRPHNCVSDHDFCLIQFPSAVTDSNKHVPLFRFIPADAPEAVGKIYILRFPPHIYIGRGTGTEARPCLSAVATRCNFIAIYQTGGTDKNSCRDLYDYVRRIKREKKDYNRGTSPES